MEFGVCLLNEADELYSNSLDVVNTKVISLTCVKQVNIV